jgi:hypothetical protein
MIDSGIHPVRPGEAVMSHYVQLALTLFSLGVIPPGGFVLVETRHDPDCPSLSTRSGLACSCDCEIVFDGESYLYSEVVKQRWQHE